MSFENDNILFTVYDLLKSTLIHQFFGQRLSSAALPTLISSAEKVSAMVIGISLFTSSVSL